MTESPQLTVKEQYALSLGEKEYSEILQMTEKEQKQKIEKFIRNKDTKQNRIREKIENGTYIESYFN